jgi:hypothetical protein
MFNERAVRLLSFSIGAVIAALGVWSFVAPRSFFDTTATFEPYNAHFLRDIGSMQIGLGVAGMVGATRHRAVVAGLAGLLAFEVLHVLSHVMSWNDGGRPGFDVPALSAMALLTAAALVAGLRQQGSAG